MSKIEKITLDNGLDIYFYLDKKRHSVFFQHITKFGGATKDFISNGKTYHIQDGIAHILEHYIVEENKYGNFLKLLGEAQMSTNASTHLDMTRFYFSAVENVEFGIRTLLKGIYAPLFDEERLTRIKGPIYQELRGHSNNKFYGLNMKTYDTIFNHFKFRSIGGTLEEVERTTIDDLRLCFETFYQPSNQFIVVGGNFDKDEILEIIKDEYNKLDIKKIDFEVLNLEETDEVNNEYHEIEFPTGENYLEVNYKINLDKYTNDEALKLDFYFNFFFKMFFSITSPLYNKLVKEEIITDGLSCGISKVNNYVVASIGTHTSKMDRLKDEIIKTVKELKDFDEEKFELDKKQVILSIILREENIGSTVMPFVNNIVMYNCDYPDSVEQVMSYTYDDFVKTIKEIDFSNYSVGVIKNKE